LAREISKQNIEGVVSDCLYKMREEKSVSKVIYNPKGWRA
jgi:hypothetical protein